MAQYNYQFVNNSGDVIAEISSDVPLTVRSNGAAPSSPINYTPPFTDALDDEEDDREWKWPDYLEDDDDDDADYIHVPAGFYSPPPASVATPASSKYMGSVSAADLIAEELDDEEVYELNDEENDDDYDD